MAKRGRPSKKDLAEKEQRAKLLYVNHMITEKEAVGHPGQYGMPDLLFPIGYKPGVYDPFGEIADYEGTIYHKFEDGWSREPLPEKETDEQYRERQDAALAEFITNTLFIVKDGRKVKIRLIQVMTDWIAGVFFRRVSKTITWKPRGGGGSLTAAVLIWMLLVYRNKSVLDLAGSADQSKIVYDYVKDLWSCVPGLKEGMLDGEPLSQVTRMKNGTEVKCVPSTEKQARGKHYSVVFVDELCQADPRVENAMSAAIQGALSEPDPIICLFSTFHIPVGLFQQFWDNAEEKGFERYRWSVLDTMAPCSRGLDQATEDDPKALEFCKKCFLTDTKEVLDPSGTTIGEMWEGCFGYGRDTKGWTTYENVCEAKKMNLGTSIFETEYLCKRPGFSSCVYSPELIDASLIDPVLIDPNKDKPTVGIDWGIKSKGSLALTLIFRRLEYVYVHDIIFTENMLVTDIAKILRGWKEKFGEFPIIADASHPFNNQELSSTFKFDVRPMSFGTWKNVGIENVSKYFAFRRVKINRSLVDLIKQLKQYRRKESTGAIVKKGDHGPDSLNCAMLNFRFEDEFGPDIEQAEALHDQEKMLGAKKEKVNFSAEGMASVRTMSPDFMKHMLGSEDKKNVLVF